MDFEEWHEGLAFSAFFAVLCGFALSIMVSNQNTQRRDAKDRKERREHKDRKEEINGNSVKI